MARKIQLAAILTALAVVILATTGVAAANDAAEYRAAMRTFVPVIEDWTSELQVAAHTAAIKPTPERLAVVEELAARGGYILDDLRGTAALAPQPLATAHWQLADAVGSMVSAAESIGQDPQAAATAIDAQATFAAPAVERIWNFVTRFGVPQPIVVPAGPGAGS